MSDPYLTVKDMARLLSRSNCRVTAMIRSGELPSVLIAGKWKTRASVFKRWVAERPKGRIFGHRRLATIDDARILFSLACQAVGVMEKHMRDPTRIARVVERRQIIAYFLQTRNVSTPMIGELLCRNHSTIVFAVQAMKRRLATSDAGDWLRIIDRIEKACNGAKLAA